MLRVRPHVAKLVFASALLALLSLGLFLEYTHFYPKLGRPTFNSFAQYTEYLNSHKSIANPLPSTTPVVVSTVTQPAQISTTTVTTTATLLPTSTSIPEKLWYKTGPKGIPSESSEWISQCIERNPSYRYECLTDQSSDEYVRELYVDRPDIVITYLSLRVPILRADLLRYLILYANGGIWSDLDVSCEEVPIHDWIPAQHRSQTGLVVGLEFDGEGQGDGLFTQFASWTIMARPKSPHMLQVIEDILQDFQGISTENNVTVSGIEMRMISDVVDVTGPKRMTRGIIKSLESTLGGPIDDRNVSGFKEPTLLGDVLILPGNSFAAAQSGWPEDQGPKLVTHHYAGTWKNEHGGEMAR